MTSQISLHDGKYDSFLSESFSKKRVIFVFTLQTECTQGFLLNNYSKIRVMWCWQNKECTYALQFSAETSKQNEQNKIQQTLKMEKACFSWNACMTSVKENTYSLAALIEEKHADVLLISLLRLDKAGGKGRRWHWWHCPGCERHVYEHTQKNSVLIASSAITLSS